MADDSNEIQQHLEFHPCLPPRGIPNYNLDLLSDYQKTCLKAHKLTIIRENNIYLHQHPELKLLVSVLIKEVLIARPKIKLEYFLAKYLKSNWEKLKEMMEEVTQKTEDDAEYLPEDPLDLLPSGLPLELDSSAPSSEKDAQITARNVMFRSFRELRNSSQLHPTTGQEEDAAEEGEGFSLSNDVIRNILNHMTSLDSSINE